MADSVLFTPLRAVDSNGDSIAGARAYFYRTGTTTPETVYTDTGATTPHTSPLLADANGVFPPVYTSGSYALRCVIRDASEVEVSDIDPVWTTPLTTGGASEISFTPTTEIPADDVQEAIERVQSNTTGAKTGVDSGLVSGTAGASGKLAKWNADGDLVDANHEILDEDDFASDMRYALPTQQSAKAYVDNGKTLSVDTYTANTAISTLIPSDTTIPQNTEGDEILSASITPRSNAAKVRITVTLTNTFSTNSNVACTTAIFRGTVANAIFAGMSIHENNTAPGGGVSFSYIDSPSTTSSTTYTVRFGPDAGSVQLNYYHGSAAKCSLVLEEVL